ncbi:2-dehydropantoate 2-reductase [Microthyrium microscopicum]|uniref:2-dehydropantoate 2-reductase n=1 Tax=Microthyrium microscopicum TaxID=703497 RepID=A0A6A6U9G9_9PEZI|nr:2-dehydropantoate 2-reductase [Microthyrium microscopicum]
MAAPTKPIQILFVGAGAVGCFYASRLHSPAQNIHVSLVCRSNYTAIASSGVHLQTHSFGNYTFTPSAVYSSIADAASKAPEGGWDYIVVTTKALPDVTDDSEDIAPLVEAGGDGKSAIVLIQNGVGVEEPHRKRFPKNPIVSAVTIISAEQISQGTVRQNRWTRISCGAYSDGLGGKTSAALALCKRGDEAVNALVNLWKTVGDIKDAEAYSEVDLQIVRWHKICINASMNPSAVLAGGIGNSEMSLDPDLREHLKACMEEVFDAAPKILGKPFPEKLAKPELILKSTERNTGGRPSMLVDWESGRPMELEVILGNPVRIAKRHAVEMPRLQSLYALLKSAQRQREAKKKLAKL